jgi:hypothetical protein
MFPCILRMNGLVAHIIKDVLYLKNLVNTTAINPNIVQMNKWNILELNKNDWNENLLKVQHCPINQTSFQCLKFM